MIRACNVMKTLSRLLLPSQGPLRVGQQRLFSTADPLKLLEAGVQATVDGVRSGKIKLPTSVDQDKHIATLTLPDNCAALMPGMPEMLPGSKLLLTKDTFLVADHADAVYEAWNAHDNAVWTENPRYKQFVDNVIADAAVLRKTMPSFPGLASMTAAVGNDMYRGCLVTGTSGRGKSVAMNLLALRAVAKGVPVVVEIANDLVIYVPGGDRGDAEVYVPYDGRSSIPAHVYDALHSRETMYFYDPQQTQGRVQPLLSSACTIVASSPNTKNYATLRKATLMNTHLYDLSVAEFKEIARVLKPEMSDEELEVFVALHGTNLRCLMSKNEADNFVWRSGLVARDLTLTQIDEEKSIVNAVLTEQDPHHELYGFRRPKGVSETHLYTAMPYCNTAVSLEAHKRVFALDTDRKNSLLVDDVPTLLETKTSSL